MDFNRHHPDSADTEYLSDPHDAKLEDFRKLLQEITTDQSAERRSVRKI